MNVKKFGVVYFLLIFMLSFSVLADWKTIGSGSNKDYTTNDVALYNSANKTTTSLNEYNNSLFEIISGDLDGDGLAEILTYNNSQIVIHDSDYNTLGNYFSIDVNISSLGAWVVTDFIEGNNEELVLFTTKADTTHSLYIMNWNGTDLTLTDEITSLIENSGGIVCDNFDNESDIDCMYPATDSFIYQYDSDDTTLNTPVAEYETPCHTSNVGYKGSEIYAYDIDLNGEKDFFITEYDSGKGECGDLSKYLYDIAGNNFTDEFSYSTTGYSITALTMVDLPNSANNGVAYAMGRMCSRVGTSPCCWTNSLSEVRVVNAITDVDFASYPFSEAKSTHPYNWGSGGVSCGASTRSCTPYVASLHSCFDDDSGNCDLYGANDNLFVTAVGKDTACTNFGTYEEMFVMNLSLNNLEVMDNFPMGNTTPNCDSGLGEVSHSAQLPKAVWGDFSGTGNLNVMFNEIYSKTGEFIGKTDETSTITETTCRSAYFSIDELTGDSSSEIIIKDMQDGDEKVNIVSFGDYGEEEIITVNVTPSQTCNLPVLFCDDFDYNVPMSNNDWLVYNSDGSINQDFSPNNNQLELITNESINPFHEVFFFDVEYVLDSQSTIVEDIYSPIWSSEFYMTITDDGNYDEDSCFRYDSSGYRASGWSILFCQNGSIMTRQQNLLYKETCTDCFNLNVSNTVKISSYFSQRPAFNFNSSVTEDDINIFIDGTKVDDDNITYINSDVEHLVFYDFIKDNTANVIIEDYYVYIGTDKLIDNSGDFYRPLFEVPQENLTDLGAGDGDLISSVDDFWYNNGLRSPSSRYFAGLILLFIVGLAVTGVMVQAKVHPNPLVIGGIMLLFMVFLVFIRLLPAWIPIVLGIVGAGAGALLWKFAST